MACLFGHKWNGCKCEKCGKTATIKDVYESSEIELMMNVASVQSGRLPLMADMHQKLEEKLNNPGDEDVEQVLEKHQFYQDMVDKANEYLALLEFLRNKSKAEVNETFLRLLLSLKDEMGALVLSSTAGAVQIIININMKTERCARSLGLEI